jgi:hypothetical protein
LYLKNAYQLTSHARGGSNGSSGAFWEVLGFGVAQLLSHTESDKEPWDGDEKTGPEDELDIKLLPIFGKCYFTLNSA